MEFLRLVCRTRGLRVVFLVSELLPAPEFSFQLRGPFSTLRVPFLAQADLEPFGINVERSWKEAQQIASKYPLVAADLP